MDSKPSEKIAPRITILDAGELDSAIFGIFKSQSDSALKNLPSWGLNNYSHELEAVLKFLIWKLSVGRHKASFGQQLLHLKYSDSAKYKNLQALAFLTIGVPYLKEKILKIILLRNDNRARRVVGFIENIDTAIKVLNILTFIRFLWRGGSPSFLELVLKLKPVSTVPQSTRNVGYSYMTRELVWHGFIELLLIFLPLINYHRLRRIISNFFPGHHKKTEKLQRCVFSADTLCEVCMEPPILPYQMGCSHAFCYGCLASNREGDKLYMCPGCGFSNPDANAMQPVQVSLLKDTSSTEII